VKVKIHISPELLKKAISAMMRPDLTKEQADRFADRVMKERSAKHGKDKVSIEKAVVPRDKLVGLNILRCM